MIYIKYISIKKKSEEALSWKRILSYPLWPLPSGDVASAQVNPGGSPMQPPQLPVLTLTSFPEECAPSLAADTQDQGAENDDHGKLHRAVQWRRHTKNNTFYLVWFIFFPGGNVDPFLCSKDKPNTVIYINICREHTTVCAYMCMCR